MSCLSTLLTMFLTMSTRREIRPLPPSQDDTIFQSLMWHFQAEKNRNFSRHKRQISSARAEGADICEFVPEREGLTERTESHSRSELSCRQPGKKKTMGMRSRPAVGGKQSREEKRIEKEV